MFKIGPGLRAHLKSEASLGNAGRALSKLIKQARIDGLTLDKEFKHVEGATDLRGSVTVLTSADGTRRGYRDDKGWHELDKNDNEIIGIATGEDYKS